MTSLAIALPVQPAPVRLPQSIIGLLAQFLRKMRLNNRAPDYYGDILRQGQPIDAATLMQII